MAAHEDGKVEEREEGEEGEEKEMGISSTFPPRPYPSSFYIEMILSDRKEERQEENFCRRERGNNGEG